LTRQKLGAEIQVTDKKIATAELTIERLELEIGDKNDRIEKQQMSLREGLRELYEAQSRSLVEITLSYDNLGSFWDGIETLERLNGSITENLQQLKDLKTSLITNKTALEKERASLVSLRSQKEDQKKIADATKKEKDTLLAQTKNKEGNYKTLLAQRVAQKEQFEREIQEFEAQLRVEIDPASLPPSGSGILHWPLAQIFITQKFGKTVDAKRLYVSGTHNGVDFRASVGTPVKAAGSGVVTGTGNTDLIPKCYSYGQWVLIDHKNGLSSLYAHLSLIKVSPGRTVATGDLVGYSGDSGYATGPHLHMTVYATQGVKIAKFDNSIACKAAYIPLAPANAYLDPLLYL
jgi:murein DD-endopeptidase MepM/ murein hydrolase activator NlpD